jgi:hypothetical protein
MGRIMDNSGQGSAELILIIGGLLIIILLVGNYIATIQETVHENLKKVLKKERNFIINKI